MSLTTIAHISVLYMPVDRRYTNRTYKVVIYVTLSASSQVREVRPSTPIQIRPAICFHSDCVLSAISSLQMRFRMHD